MSKHAPCPTSSVALIGGLYVDRSGAIDSHHVDYAAPTLRDVKPPNGCTRRRPSNLTRETLAALAESLDRAIAEHASRDGHDPGDEDR